MAHTERTPKPYKLLSLASSIAALYGLGLIVSGTGGPVTFIAASAVFLGTHMMLWWTRG